MSASSSSSNNPAHPPTPSTQRLEPGTSALDRTRINLSYLVLGARSSVAPASMTTRSLLTTTRYVIRYIVRRLIRYAKYAAAGALVAAVGGGLLGTVGSGLAFFAAPSVGVGMAIGVGTAVAKFGWRHRHAADFLTGHHSSSAQAAQGNQARRGWWSSMKERADAGHDAAEDEREDAEGDVRKERKRERPDVWMRM